MSSLVLRSSPLPSAPQRLGPPLLASFSRNPFGAMPRGSPHCAVRTALRPLSEPHDRCSSTRGGRSRRSNEFWAEYKYYYPLDCHNVGIIGRWQCLKYA